MTSATVPLSEIAAINPDTVVRAGLDDLCTFVPMSAVDEEESHISIYASRPYRELAKGYTPFADQDVLVAKITPCMENGKCAIARGLRDGVGFGSTEFHVVRASSKVLPEWIYYFWRFPATRILAERNMTGTAGQKRVPTAFLERLRIPLPPLEEQTRFVRALAKMDHLCRMRRYALHMSDEFRLSSFCEKLKNYQQTPTPLSELCQKITDGVHITPTYVPKGVPFLRVTDIQDDEIDWRSVKRISHEEYDEITRRVKAEVGDILYSKNGTIGIAKEITWKQPFAHFVSLALLKPNKALVNSTFLTSWLNTPEALRQATGHSKTLTVTNLHLNEIEKIRVPLPSMSAQDELVSRIESANRLRGIHVEALRQADHLFQTLLHQTFSPQ
jgi:type I restriction enzyme S subunit